MIYIVYINFLQNSTIITRRMDIKLRTSKIVLLKKKKKKIHQHFYELYDRYRLHSNDAVECNLHIIDRIFSNSYLRSDAHNSVVQLLLHAQLKMKVFYSDERSYLV